jgi:hypothetical protein
MGAGNVHSREYRLSSTVFLMMRKQNGSLKNWIKYFRPTNSLPKNPFEGVYRSNAMTIPYIGKYRKTTTMITGTRHMAYSSLSLIQMRFHPEFPSFFFFLSKVL